MRDNFKKTLLLWSSWEKWGQLRHTEMPDTETKGHRKVESERVENVYEVNMNKRSWFSCDNITQVRL